jgi:hypothetical protein
LLPEVFSFTDYFLGLLIISVGLSIYVVLEGGFWVENFLGSISFLSLLSSSFLSNTPAVALPSYTTEYLWLEVFGGRGVTNLISRLTKSLYFYFLIHFSPMLLMFVLLMLMVN